ncbi:hypothetical protein GHT06_015299 [Daphnia sinensis]|uniref:Uncharacterized protein n=1 Tax=Daphnia sinensis TaxID=1820382 RepID=A0AAD5PST8_9CRUS|nr:hypothetical protein GHT06_015299 [Daphnia sinensis]
MSSPLSMEVDTPTSLTPQSGALAIIEKGIQLHENFPEGGSENISPVSVNPSARSVPFNKKSHPKPITARQITDSHPDTYILIRSKSESIIKDLQTQLNQLTENQPPGRPTNEKREKIASLKQQIQNHQTEIKKANSALALVQTQNLHLQQANFDATISSIAQQATNERLIGEAHSHIASIQSDKNFLESQAYQLLGTNSQLEQLLSQKTLELETCKQEILALKSDFNNRIDHGANQTIFSLQNQALSDKADISNLKTYLNNRSDTQTELEAKVKSLSEDLSLHATQYSISKRQTLMRSFRPSKHNL